MTVQLQFSGHREEGDHATRGGTPVSGVTGLLDAFEVVDAFNLSRSARARNEAPVKVPVEDDDVLEIEVEGGFTSWYSARRYYDEVQLLKPQAKVGDAV